MESSGSGFDARGLYRGENFCKRLIRMAPNVPAWTSLPYTDLDWHPGRRPRPRPRPPLLVAQSSTVAPGCRASVRGSPADPGELGNPCRASVAVL
jgi:hypothetical protein